MSREAQLRVAQEFLAAVQNARALSRSSGRDVVCGLDGGAFRLPPDCNLGLGLGGDVAVGPYATETQLWDCVYMTPWRLAALGGPEAVVAMPPKVMEMWYASIPPFPTQRRVVGVAGPDGTTPMAVVDAYDVPGPFLLTQLDVGPANVRVDAHGHFAGFVANTYAGYFPDWWQSWVLLEQRLCARLRSGGDGTHPQALWAAAVQGAIACADEAELFLIAAMQAGSVDAIAAWRYMREGQLRDHGVDAFKTICVETLTSMKGLEHPANKWQRLFVSLYTNK